MKKDDRERRRINKCDSCESKRMQKNDQKYEKRMFLSLFLCVVFIDACNVFFFVLKKKLIKHLDR
jgi:hypothetical protein